MCKREHETSSQLILEKGNNFFLRRSAYLMPLSSSKPKRRGLCVNLTSRNNTSNKRELTSTVDFSACQAVGLTDQIELRCQDHWKNIEREKGIIHNTMANSLANFGECLW